MRRTVRKEVEMENRVLVVYQLEGRGAVMSRACGSAPHNFLACDFSVLKRSRFFAPFFFFVSLSIMCSLQSRKRKV